MRSRDTAILVVPGIGDVGPDHWQTRWEGKLPNARRVVSDPLAGLAKETWEDALRLAITAADRPVVLLAHGLGVIVAVAVLTAPNPPPVAGAFLVAPPSEAALAARPEIDAAFRPFPAAPLPCPSVLVGSRNDPQANLAETEGLALDWGSRFVDAGEAGPIDATSGHGPWPEGLMTFAGFLSKL